MQTWGIILAVLTIVSALMMRVRSIKANKPVSIPEALIHGILGLAALYLLYVS